MWNRSGFVLQALADALKEIRKGLVKVKPDDFSIPNHYAKLAYHAGEAAMLDRVLSLLPDSVEK